MRSFHARRSSKIVNSYHNTSAILLAALEIKVAKKSSFMQKWEKPTIFLKSFLCFIIEIVFLKYKKSQGVQMKVSLLDFSILFSILLNFYLRKQNLTNPRFCNPPFHTFPQSLLDFNMKFHFFYCTCFQIQQHPWYFKILSFLPKLFFVSQLLSEKHFSCLEGVFGWREIIVFIRSSSYIARGNGRFRLHWKNNNFLHFALRWKAVEVEWVNNWLPGWKTHSVALK